MIHYSIDTNEREKVYVILALASVSLVSFLDKLLSHFTFEEYAAPSAMVVFLTLTKFYDVLLWKFAVKIGFSSIPNINGKWLGELSKNTGQRFPVSSASFRAPMSRLDSDASFLRWLSKSPLPL